LHDLVLSLLQTQLFCRQSLQRCHNVMDRHVPMQATQYTSLVKRHKRHTRHTPHVKCGTWLGPFIRESLANLGDCNKQQNQARRSA
jgi:hypothetical protein